MRDVIALVLLLGGTILTWLIGFRDGRQVERELAHVDDLHRRIKWLLQELERAHRQHDASGRPPGPQTTEPAWDPEREPDYE